MSNKITENDVRDISFGDGKLNFEINPVNDISGINKDIFIKNYGSNKNIITMSFLYNKELTKDNINKFNLKFKTDNLYEGSVLIVSGGGGGGYDIGGGGGGGEVIYIDNISFKGNINYNIIVGKGGKEGSKSYYHGDSGYNSGINDIVAIGGGGGASYYAETAYSLLNKSKSKFRYLREKGGGLDGGSGGGGCGFQYGNDDEVSNYKYGKKKNLKNPVSAFDNYYTFGNNGGVGNSYIKEEEQLVKVRGAGGGGAGEVGDNSTNEDTTHFGKGGDGISIEKIDINTGTTRFCPLTYHRIVSSSNSRGDVIEGFSNIIKKGLKYHYYNQGYAGNNVNWFVDKTPVSTGYVWDGSNIGTLSNNTRTKNSANYYSFIWTGYFKAKTSGTYTFSTSSDDASFLWIGDNASTGYTIENAIVNNKGTHPVQMKQGTINLTENTYYPIRIQFGENRGGDNLIVQFKIPGSNTWNSNGGEFYFSGDNLEEAGRGSSGNSSGSANRTSGNSLECNIIEINEFVTNKVQEKLRTIVTGNEKNVYWGGGGGAGSYNTNAGNGGKGGGGGGGYYEGIHDALIDSNRGHAGAQMLGEKVDTKYDGKSSAVEISQDNIDNDIAKGGDGLPHTGGGGGGGGLASKGGNGGSGIVIIMLKTKEKLIEVESPEYTLTDIENMLSEFDNNKKEFGKNLSKLYNYNIKEHREFYDYIDHIYEDNVLKKNVPHGIINDENKVRKDFEIMKYNYDRDVYDIKFHQYLKIIFDLKINYDSFLLYSKIRDEDVFGINEKLYDYQRLMIIILDIIENIIILIRNDKKYYELINNIDILEIALLNNKRERYDLKEDLSELDNDIELLNTQLIEINNDIYNLEKKENDGENTKNEQDTLRLTKTNLESLLLGKEKDKKEKLEADLYYNYSEKKSAGKKKNILKFYISNNNNFEIYNTNSQTTENLLKEQLFEYYKINTINLKKILEYKDINELIKGENEPDNDIQLIIKIYIYSLLKIKKQNFIKNILSIYIYMSYANILQKFYKESEEFLLGNNIINYSRDKEKTLCKSTLYNNLQKIDNTIDRMKSLLGYSFINEYINDYKINEANLISSSCPYVRIELNDYDSNAIILMLFRKTKNDNLILNCDVDDTECHSKERLNLLKYKDYYKNLKESFLIEIDNNRYSIHDFNFRKENTHDEKIVDIIEFIIDDRYSKICKTSVEKKIKDIYILSKDSSHINDIYDNDLSLLDKYSENVEKQKKELDNINDKYNKYKYHYEKSKYKYNIYYFILFLILIVIIILNITGTNSYMKTLTYLIILSVLTILIIYNHFTKVNLSIVEKFTKYEEKKEQIFYDYYNLATVTVENSNPNLDSAEYFDIKLQLDEHDKYKLKIRKFKNMHKNTDGYVNKLVKDNLRIYYNNRIENITNVIITDDDPHYYYITNITFKHNNKVPVGPIKDVVLLKHDESIIEKLLKDKNYKTITGDARDKLCDEVCKTTEELNSVSTEEKLKIKNKKKIYIFTVRNDILRYINNKFIDINKIIESIELEKANNLSNKVHKSLTNEKKNLLNYQKQYDSKKLKNINVNNLYKHEIIGQSAFINFIIIFSLILILLLLLVNIFPTKILVIMIIGFILISGNIYNYILNSSYRTRKDANKKYW